MTRAFRYETVADDLRQQIRRGDFGRQKLPSERALMAQYGVQRSTVRRALAILGAEGIITTSEKRGSFIQRSSNDPVDSLSRQTINGSVLVIGQRDDSSTAMESLLRGLAPSLSASGLSLLFFDSRPKPGRTCNELPDEAYLVANQVRAILLWPHPPTDIGSLNRMRNLTPLILVDRQVPGFETHSVVFDDFSGGRAVTEHLLARGHRRIGFLTDEVFAETVQQRWRGYTQALEDAGIAPEPTCYGLFQGMRNPPYTEQMHLLLQGGGRPLSAVVCSNDTVALDFMNLVRRDGRRVPEDIAVTGFGNLLPTSMEAMRLTTVLQPFEAAGEAVGKLLLQQVSANPYRNHGEYEHIEIAVQLIVRASSGSR